MAFRNAVQSVTTNIPRVIHNLVLDKAQKADVDPALIYSAAVMAIGDMDPIGIAQITNTAKLEVLRANMELPPPPTRTKKADPVNPVAA